MVHILVKTSIAANGTGFFLKTLLDETSLQRAFEKEVEAIRHLVYKEHKKNMITSITAEGEKFIVFKSSVDYKKKLVDAMMGYSYWDRIKNINYPLIVQIVESL